MPYLPVNSTPELWGALQWQDEELVVTARIQEPLEARAAPRAPGIYRITWTNPETWAAIQHNRLVVAAAAIADPVLHFDDLQPPVILSVGKATNLYSRLRQHFGNNPNNNRLLRRLAAVLPNEDNNEIRAVAVATFRFLGPSFQTGSKGTFSNVMLAGN